MVKPVEFNGFGFNWENRYVRIYVRLNVSVKPFANIGKMVRVRFAIIQKTKNTQLEAEYRFFEELYYNKTVLNLLSIS